MSTEIRRIEQFFRERCGRDALFVPSGRFALYLVLREWFRHGDRVLISPVNCDVVFFTALAAGVVPVVGPVDPSTGNLDPDAVDDATWLSVRGVVTTNLYGIPDRMDRLVEQRRRHGLVLIEDACHAIDSHFEGRRIGTFGDAAVYSLAKHVEGVGGVVTVQDASRREALARRGAAELRNISPVRRAMERVRDRVAPRQIERVGHRLKYEPREVTCAQQEGAGLDRFDKWLSADHGRYRTLPSRSSLRETVERLEALDEHCRLRAAGARRLRDLGYLDGVRVPDDTALFRVPLFVAERDVFIRSCASRGLAIDYVYDPPLDLYAQPLWITALPSPPAARMWSRDVVPVNPLHADQFLELLKDSPAVCPARHGLAAVATCQ